MGLTISRARGHYFTRNMQRFNIEARTERLLDADKPVPAPRHIRDLERVQDMQEDDWNKMETDIKLKNEEHSGRLKDVYVTSEDPEGFDSEINRRRPSNPDRPMPMKLPVFGSFNPGFNVREGYVPPLGKLTLMSIQELLVDFKSDKKTNNAGALAAKYNVNLAEVESICDHYKVFTYIQNKTSKATQKMLQDAKDPYRAQPDWVEAAGEIPPIVDTTKSPTLGEIALTPKEEFEVKRERPKLLPKDNLVGDPTRKRVESGEKSS